MCTIAGLLQIFRPVSVKLIADRFEISNGLGKTFAAPWDDIQPFFILQFSSTKLVSFNDLEGRGPAKRSALAKMSSALGADGSLPNTLPLNANALLKLMNERRDQALARRPAR